MYHISQNDSAILSLPLHFILMHIIHRDIIGSSQWHPDQRLDSTPTSSFPRLHTLDMAGDNANCFQGSRAY